MALYSAAVEPRIQAALVSGYFDSRQKLWAEPVYRNIWALLQEFGDAEIASMIAPRPLVIEYSAVQPVDHGGGKQAAPGKLETPAFASVRGEMQRAGMLFPKNAPLQPAFTLIAGNGGTAVGPGSSNALHALLEGLGVSKARSGRPDGAPPSSRSNVDIGDRQRRQVQELTDYVQKLLHLSERRRNSFWSRARTTSPEHWREDAQWYRNYLRTEIVGQVVTQKSPPNPRTRQLFDKPKYAGYEVLLDVWPDVRAWGYLLVPKNIQPNERRPVVVCQHGLGGTPESVVTEDTTNPEYSYYHAFATRLVEQGFVVYAPYNPYKGEYRKLQRKANPLKLSLFSIIIGEHETALDWLTQLPFVDPTRIGFYGLSYGGRTAMIVPPLLERYALSISSGNFTDWVSKRIDIYDPHCGMYGDSVELQDFGVGDTFNHAELASLMIPRPFMVERGIDDETAKPEGVGYEYTKVRRLYSTLDIAERTTIEFRPGGHRIYGRGTFEFLHKYLNWPDNQGGEKDEPVN
jgi:hypothetical protein